MNRLIRLPALMDRTGFSRSTIDLFISRGTCRSQLMSRLALIYFQPYRADESPQIHS